MTPRSMAFLEAASMCRFYSYCLSEIPGGADVALECAAMLEEAGELVPTITEIGTGACQVVFVPSMAEINGLCV